MTDADSFQADPHDLTGENESLAEENKKLAEENEKLKERIERQEALLSAKVDTKSSKKPIFAENYSLGRNKINGQGSDKKSSKKKFTGRKPREANEHLVSDTIAIFPPDTDRRKCVHHRFQSAWRIGTPGTGVS